MLLLFRLVWCNGFLKWMWQAAMKLTTSSRRCIFLWQWLPLPIYGWTDYYPSEWIHSTNSNRNMCTTRSCSCSYFPCDFQFSWNRYRVCAIVCVECDLGSKWIRCRHMFYSLIVWNDIRDLALHFAFSNTEVKQNKKKFTNAFRFYWFCRSKNGMFRSVSVWSDSVK